jgi:hypothetical protein
MSEHANPDPARPAEPASESEPLDVWWPKYMDRVDKSVTDTELYLEIPEGTISSIPRDPDFVAVVKACAVIEPMLNDLICSRPPRTPYGTLAAALAAPESDESFRSFVSGLNIGGRVGKVELAKCLGLLGQHQVRFVEGVARIRNRYAHNVRNISISRRHPN